MRSSPKKPPLAYALVSGLMLAGCGPSVQAVHEGTLRFEHCFRLDLDTRITQPHRNACWQEWLKSYTYGQSRDRIEYARRRARALSEGDAEPRRLKLDPAGESLEREFYLSVPAPLDPHAPPPPLVPRAPRNEARGPHMPEDACARACLSSRGSCLEGCPRNEEAAGGAPAHCEACRVEYKQCMVRCYE